MDKLDFLDGPTPEPTAAVSTPEPAAPPAAQPAAPTEGQPRGPDGKFAPKAEAATPAPAAAPAPIPAPAAAAEPAPPAAEPAKAPDGYVPVGVVQEMRRELQALKANQPPPQPAAPRLQPGQEGYEDQQYEEYVRETASAAARINLATRYATEKHGEEKVQSALAWARDRAEADPVFRQQSWSADDPVAFAITEQQRHEGLSFAAEMFSDPKAREDFQAWRNGQAPTPAAAAPVVVAPPSPSPPPRSMASAPNAGGAQPGAIPVGLHAAFDTVFKE